jgi:hypothetical protein
LQWRLQEGLPVWLGRPCSLGLELELKGLF